MNQIPAISGTAQDADTRSESFIVGWLRDLEECRQGGFLSDEDYAEQRAEKLAELLCKHRFLWLATVASASCFAAVAGGAAWIAWMDLDAAIVIGGMAALFGILMMSHPCREELKHAQIRDRLQLLNTLLSLDLITSDEFVIYEERLHCGSAQLQLIGNL